MTRVGKKEFIGQCANAAIELFTEGVADPSAKEIAERVWGENAYVSALMVDDVRRKLAQIRKLLAEDEGCHTCPLSSQYYRKFRGPKRRPQSRDEARRCVVGKQEGLLKLGVQPELDIIWAEHRDWQAKAGTAKAGGVLSDVRRAVDDGQLPVVNGKQITSEALAELVGVQTGWPEQTAIEQATGE